jgi:drug/metabolite transporter (DMT)-like permease
MHWVTYSIVATISLGTAAALYKIPSNLGHSSLFSTFWANAFAALAVCCGLLVCGESAQIAFPSTWYALFVGASFASIMALTKTLMKNIDVGVVFPVTSALSAVGTIGTGLVILDERLSLVQTVGVVTILLSTYMFTRKGGPFPVNARTALLTGSIVTLSTFGKYWQRQGVMKDPPTQFLLWQLIASAGFALLLSVYFERKRFKEILHVEQYLRGSGLIGLFTAIGGAAIVQALHRGPMSGVYAIHPSYILISGFLGSLLFNEAFTRKKVLLAVLSVVGVLLVKIG